MGLILVMRDKENSHVVGVEILGHALHLVLLGLGRCGLLGTLCLSGGGELHEEGRTNSVLVVEGRHHTSYQT